MKVLVDLLFININQNVWKKENQNKICKEIEKYRNYLDNRDFAVLTKEEREAKLSMDFHRDIVHNRTENFKSDLTNENENTCTLIIDFKANISLGKGPVEDSHIFFLHPKEHVLGLPVIF